MMRKFAMLLVLNFCFQSCEYSQVGCEIPMCHIPAGIIDDSETETVDDSETQISSYCKIVDIAPPCEIREECGPCPNDNYIWKRGSWQWDGQRWKRVHGHWAIKPEASAIWVPGYWSKFHHLWYWQEGYWQYHDF